MKNKLMLRLFLMMAVVLSTYSCRQDLLPEKETYRNTSAFQLISKRISLDEAKHKDKLLPELQKAKKEVEKQKLNIQGKLVDIGNGIVIDTDEVIYMENGPDFHTYTFSVVRDNASANAPVENILMSPNTDGSYRVFHIVLNLTEADKAKIANKEFVNFKTKSQVTELASMNLSSLSQRSNCTPEYYSYPIPCSDANYRHLPGESCQLSGTSGEAYWATGVFWNCQNIPEPLDNVITPSEGGPGGGSGSTNPGTPPNHCITTVTNPGEVGLINESGCNTIVPTQPNMPNPQDERTPCQILKDNSADPVFQGKLDSLKNRTVIHKDTAETVINVKKAGANLVYNVSVKKTDIGFANTTSVEGEVSRYDIAGMHNHPPKHLPIFSFDDIVAFYSSYKFVDIRRKPVYTFYVTSENGTTYALRMNDVSALDTLFAGLNLGADVTTEEEKLIARDKMRKLFKKHGEDDFLYDQTRAEKLFMNVLSDPEVGGSNGMHVYRKDANGWGKLKMDANGNVTKENCPL